MLINKFIKSLRPQVPDYWPKELKDKVIRILDRIEKKPIPDKVGLASSLNFNGKTVTLQELFDHFETNDPTEFRDSDFKEFGDNISRYNDFLFKKITLNISYEGVFNATVSGILAGGSGIDINIIIEKAHEAATIAILSSL